MEHDALQSLALASFFFVLAVTARSFCSIGFLERPIALGFVWWLCTGNPLPALPLALFFELFWLDLFPIGSYIPPMPTLPYLLLLALSKALGWMDPVTLAFPLAATMPLAYAVPLLEYKQRDLQKHASTNLIRMAEELRPLNGYPARLVLRSFFQQAGGGLLLFIGLYFVMYLLFSLEMTRRNAGFIPLDVDWSILYAIAAIGALLSLRIKRAYSVFALCMAGLLLFRVV